MKVSMKNQTKFQKRFMLCPKENTIRYSKKCSESSSFISKYRFLNMSKNKHLDTRLAQQIEKKPFGHLTLMNLGVEEKEVMTVPNSTYTTKRLDKQMQSNTKDKLFQLTNRRNHFQISSYSSAPQSIFEQPFQKQAHFLKKQNFLLPLKYNNENNAVSVDKQSIQIEGNINLQNNCNLVKNRRKHKKKIYKLISNHFFSDQKQNLIEEFKQKKTLQRMIEKYKFQNFKLNDSLKGPQLHLINGINHNRYETITQILPYQKQRSFINGKVSSSLCVQANFQLQEGYRKNKVEQNNQKVKKLNLKAIKNKGFREQCLSPWNQNIQEKHNIENIF